MNAPQKTLDSPEVAVLKADLARLARRVAALEEAAVRPHSSNLAPQAQPLSATNRPLSPPAKSPEPISEEIVLVLSAAVAAYLGKRPVIRQSVYSPRKPGLTRAA